MTVAELLNWIIRAHDFQENSGFDEIKDQYKLCLKQSLEKCRPTEDRLGYDADLGELELAIAIAYTLSYGEVMDMNSGCYDRTPPKIERFNARYLNESGFPPPRDPNAPRATLRPVFPPYFEPFRHAQSTPDRAPATPPIVERAVQIQEELIQVETRARTIEQEVISLTQTRSEEAVIQSQDENLDQQIDQLIAELEAEIVGPDSQISNEQAHSNNNGYQR